MAIVLMAIVLDQLTQAYANRSADYARRDTASFFKRHMHSVLFVVILFASIIAAYFFRDVLSLSKKLLLFDSKDALELDKIIKAITFELIDYIRPIRDFITVNILIPIRDFYQSVPWPITVGLIALLSYRLGGWALAALSTSLLLLIILFVGNWEYATTTFYFVSSALIVCVLIGVPLGVLSAKNPRAARVIMLGCDTLQTFPSFIYLVPAIMLFRVGELAIIFAIVPYATVPVRDCALRDGPCYPLHVSRPQTYS